MSLRSIRRGQERKFFFFFFAFSHYVHYAMVKRESLFSLCHYVHYAMIKRKKRFFHLVTTFNTAWSREKKKFLFIQSLRSLRHNHKRQKSFSRLVTMFTTPWSREFFFFFLFFHFSTTFATPWLQEKETDFDCTTTLTTL